VEDPKSKSIDIFENHPGCDQCGAKTISMMASRAGTKYTCENGHYWWGVQIPEYLLPQCVEPHPLNIIHL